MEYDAELHKHFAWQRFFAWKRVPTPDYIEKSTWLEFALRRRNPISLKWEYKKTYTPSEEVEILNDRMAW